MTYAKLQMSRVQDYRGSHLQELPHTAWQEAARFSRGTDETQVHRGRILCRIRPRSIYEFGRVILPQGISFPPISILNPN